MLLERNFTRLRAGNMDAETVIARLNEAGRALLSLPNTGPSTRLVQSGMEWARDASEITAPVRGRIRPPIPDAATITRMDQALGWIPLIPVNRYVLRRVVGARCLVDPASDRHLYSWRRLALAVGADHKAVQRWHTQGIGMIVDALSRLREGRSIDAAPSRKRDAVTAGRAARAGATGQS